MFPTTASAAQSNSLSTARQTTNEKPDKSFTDVKKSDWFYNAVEYTQENGFFSGTSSNTFEPNRTMTRGMFITVLGRMAGVDTTNYKGESTFLDVATDAYYAPYVAWAAKHGIALGVGDGKFAPNKLINRQQMAVFLVRYFETFDVDYETGVKITTTPADIDKVSKYAKDAVLKLWKNGLLVGDGVNFNPLSKASRAQAATLCMRTDKAVEIWYKEPGVPKSVTPTVTPSISDSSSPGNPSGGSTKVYYSVTLNAGKESTTKLYPIGTLLNTMPVPAQEGGMVFLGWYYDSALSNMVASTDTLTSNVNLYAKFTEAVLLTEDGQINFVTEMEATEDFTITMNADRTPVSDTDFIFRNITDPSLTDGSPDVEQETLTVNGSSGNFTVASANGGFTPGHTYQIQLLSDEVTFDGMREEIRYYNFIIQKNEVMKLTLNDEIKYIDAFDLSETDRNNVLQYAGLYQAVTDAQGETTYTSSSGSGSFNYSGSGIVVGDTVAVYTNDKPDKRTVEDSGSVAYIKITGIDGTTYYYQSADSDDVLFTPDLLPIDLDTDAGDMLPGVTFDSNGSIMSGSLTIDTNQLDFNDGNYAEMGLGEDTVVEPGDYLSFFTGVFGTSAQHKGYGIIKSVIPSGSSTTIIYSVVSEEDVLSAMELYSESELTEDVVEEAYDEQLIRAEVESQLKSSGFIEEAGEYLASLAIQTDEVKEIFGSQDGLTLSDYIVTYSDGTPVSGDDLALMGNIVDKEGGVDTSVSVSPRLSHFEGKKGVRVEVAVTYKFDIKKSGSNKKVEVELTAFFEQEVVFGFSVSGGAVWKWKWIFPYIADYRMTGNIDLGTYTGVGITATAQLDEEEEPWGMPWPKNAKEAQASKKIFSLSESIKEMMEEAETVFPEAEASASGGLAEKYAEFMEDANEKWTDLFVVNLVDLRGAVDPLHILAYGIQVDFVVSANLNVAIGMTFQYENSKRHSFTMSLKNKNAASETIDLSTNGYQFDFYVMGSLGIRAGVRAKALVGLFSTKLDGIGLQIEAGAYARLWGYFYYSLTNYKVGGKWEKNSSSSGAMLVEIGAYLDVKFVAEVLNGKYSYAPTIFAKEWPFWSAGQRENVYDFAYENAPSYNIQNVTTYTLPATVFEMKWMDLKTGDIGTDDKPITKNFDDKTAVNTKDEKYFAVELSNPAFTYNPVNNQIIVSRASGDSTLSCEMKLTWKGAPLAFSTETLSRTITLKWSDVINGKTMVFESNGGTPIDMICKLAGANISALKPANPTKAGYTFAGWYTNSDFTGTAYNIPSTMPNENLKLYAKWTPNVAPYTVEHYQQGLDGRYVLKEPQTLSGISTQTTNATAKSYEGFTPKTIVQKTIQADGNTVVAIYYDRNSYTLTLNYGPEADNRSVTVKYPFDAKIEVSNPTLAGYSFQQWDRTIPTVMPANNLSFTAIWTARQDTKYTVEHYQETLTNGNYVLFETEIKEGSSNANVTPEVKNYLGFTSPSAQTVTIKGDGTAVVKYYYTRTNYTLTYVLGNGESNDLLTYKFGANIPARLDPSRNGFSFAGWMENGVAASIPSTMPARDVTLSAKWTVKQYTITFDSKGGSAVAAITKDYGTAVTEPTAPTKTGYIFAGWQLNGNNYTFETMPAANITLTAVWTADSNIAYKVEHYKQNLDGTYPSTASETENLSGSTDATVSATAKIYNGFSYDPNASGTVSSGTVTADGSLVLKLYYSRNSYTVTWNGNGGTVNTSGASTGSVKYGATITKPTTNPSRTGYSFSEWSGFTSNMTMPAADITFNAVWTAKSYTITFDSNGGSTVAAITQAYDTLVTAPVAPTKQGYSFAGWQLNGVNYTFTTMPAENITLVAVWSDMPSYIISFDANGGTVNTAMKTVIAGNTYGELPTPTYEGHYFLGWFMSANGGTKVTSESMVVLSADQTLYARWTTRWFTGTVKDVLYVAGIQVTAENMNDILGDGSASVQYDPSTTRDYAGFTRDIGTLFLNNANIIGNFDSTAIYCSGSLLIDNTGTSTVTNTYNGSDLENVYGVIANRFLTFEGSGTITITSGTGGTRSNCGIRCGFSGADILIIGPTVKAFAGEAVGDGKSYGVFAGYEGSWYATEMPNGTLEAHGYDSAVYAVPNVSEYFITKDYVKIATITASINYDGSGASSVAQDASYKNYKYITVTTP